MPGLLDKIVPQPLRNILNGKKDNVAVTQGYKTFTEWAPRFASWDGSLYEEAQTRAIVECISTHCAKLKPEFVTPEGSGGSLPRVQRLFTSNPNEMQTWPDFIKAVITNLLLDTTSYIVPGYDRDGNIVALWPMKPSYTEVIEYDGEPWLRFHTDTGDVQAFPFYDVAIVTRFQLDSDIFGGGNRPLTPTLRLMDAQRQAEEIALKTGADIRFVGKVVTNMHEDDLTRFRDRFSQSNFGSDNKSALVLYDNRIDSLQQIDQDHFTIEPEEMERIDKALYQYFTINESILKGDFTEAQWAGFYELCIEPKLIALGSALTRMLLTRTQVRKGNYIMFSSGYLEYATPDTKVKVVGSMLERGIMNVNEARDVFQLPHLPGGTARMIRGEYYMIDDDNNIIAESGGRTDHDTTTVDEPDLLDEPEDNDDGGTE
jgi:HK97 family phage portal protein